MVGTIDHLDQVTSSDEDWAQGNDYYFICKSHKEYFDRLMAETETTPSARDRMSLFYLLSSLKKFRVHPDRFLFFNDLQPNPQAFRELLSPQEQAIVQLAFYLYTGRNIFSISIFDLFNNLEEEYPEVVIDVFKMRFGIEDES